MKILQRRRGLMFYISGKQLNKKKLLPNQTGAFTLTITI